MKKNIEFTVSFFLPQSIYRKKEKKQTQVFSFCFVMFMPTGWISRGNTITRKLFMSLSFLH